MNHHFYGDYSAGIGIGFDDPQSAALALPKLQPRNLPVQWRQGEKARHVAVICVNSEQLEVLKQHLGELGADVDAIDSVDHSIDYGDPFTVEVEVEDPRQLQLV